jgi:zinc protease
MRGAIPAAPLGGALSSRTVLPGRRAQRRLANGLELWLLAIPGAAVVSTTLWYRVGTRDEPPGQGGLGHFLEHMMFKGGRRYGPGEIDRRTQALGGINNAYTSHDATVYYFKFSPQCWREALAIEADRMAGLLLDPVAVASERQVILEEIAMYQSDPWDALEQEVMTTLFGDHPYGRPVLGSREEVATLGAAELEAFHRSFYRPDNALLVVAGGVGEEAFDAVEEALGALPPGAEPRAAVQPAAPRPPQRVERRQGEVPRLLLALPAPPADHPDHPGLRVLAAALAGGRTSRLHRELVEDRELCLWVAASVAEHQGDGVFTVATELHEGVEPARVEELVSSALAALGREPLSPAELERARKGLLADWLFGHEQVHHLGLSLGFGAALFEPGHAQSSLEKAVSASAEELAAMAHRRLAPEAGGVVGWALPRGRKRKGA